MRFFKEARSGSEKLRSKLIEHGARYDWPGLLTFKERKDRSLTQLLIILNEITERSRWKMSLSKGPIFAQHLLLLATPSLALSATPLNKHISPTCFLRETRRLDGYSAISLKKERGFRLTTPYRSNALEGP